MHYTVIITGIPSDSNEVDDIVQNSRDQGIYTTHSETNRPVHVPVFQRVPVNVPHPVAVSHWRFKSISNIKRFFTCRLQFHNIFECQFPSLIQTTSMFNTK